MGAPKCRDLLIPCLMLLTGMAAPSMFTSASPSAEYCMDLGFQSNSLLCSSCDKLSDFDLEDELGEQCRSCCKSKDESKAEEAQKFASASIEVCG
ncbi:hypothetical protein RvY_14580 [Ramazzottius varieornatus]|uniref:Selenoprotein F/M domain-containing protein n=1 Tax=Ramazzottius varieornatus TaxID=947166 RepID=A0A1D1VRU7_RAMVA|nr:hypothetical protein RvY_14580 [Ramazzottius varieornatus]